MKTSYYSCPLLTGQMNLVRISTSAPHWFSLPLRDFSELYPGWGLVGKYKTREQNEAESRALYTVQVLSGLNPREIWERLGSDAVLLCWERAARFCHRRLVAEWLEKSLGVEVRELGGEDKLF